MASIVVRFAHNGPEVGVLVHAGPKTYSIANLYGITIEQRVAQVEADIAAGRSGGYHERWERSTRTVVIDTESPVFAERMESVKRMMAEQAELRQRVRDMETLARETYKARIKESFPEVQ